MSGFRQSSSSSSSSSSQEPQNKGRCQADEPSSTCRCHCNGEAQTRRTHSLIVCSTADTTHLQPASTPLNRNVRKAALTQPPLQIPRVSSENVISKFQITCRGNVSGWKGHHAGPSTSVSFHFSDIRMTIFIYISNLKKQLPTIADLFRASYIYGHSFGLWIYSSREQLCLQVDSDMLRTSWIIQTQLTKSFNDTHLGFFKVEYKHCRVLRSPANFRFPSMFAFPAGLSRSVGVCKSSSSIQRCSANSAACLWCPI